MAAEVATGTPAAGEAEALVSCLLSLPEQVLYLIMASLDTKDLLQAMQACSYLLTAGLPHIDTVYTHNGEMPARAWQRFHAATKLVVHVDTSDPRARYLAKKALVSTARSLPTRLTFLSINVQSIDSASLLAVAGALQGHPQLRKITIINIKLSFVEIAMLLQAGIPQLKELCTTVDIQKGVTFSLRWDEIKYQHAANLAAAEPLLEDVRAAVREQLVGLSWEAEEEFTARERHSFEMFTTAAQKRGMPAEQSRQAANAQHVCSWVDFAMLQQEQSTLPVVVYHRGCTLRLELQRVVVRAADWRGE